METLPVLDSEGISMANVHIDPTERMVLIIMMQTSVGALQRDFENAVSQAIVK